MLKRRGFYGILVITLILSITFVYSCAKPPAMEIENAEKAIADAKQKEADLYVQDVFKMAEDSLKSAKDLVAVKKHKEAKKAAEDALRLAQQAIPMIETNKAKMKTEAEQMVNDIQAGLDEFKSLVTKAIKKKAAINREEIQGMIGKWEVDFVSAKDQLQAEKVRQAYDVLNTIQGELNSQKEIVVAALEPKPAEKK